MRHLIVTFLASLVASGAWATSIDINLGSPAIYTNAQLGPIPFADLNGTPLNGSPLSIDFFFSGSEFIRLFSNTSPSFEIGLNLRTNAGTFPGFVTDASGYLIATGGGAIPASDVIGRSEGSNGTTSIGLFPLPSDSGTLPLDFYGVHLQFTLSNDLSASIVGADISLFGQGRYSQFGVGPQVPDTGSTFLMFVVATSGLVAAKKWRSMSW